MAFGAPEDEERDIRLALDRLTASLTEDDVTVMRELLPEHPSLRRLLVAQMDLVRASALVANDLAPNTLVGIAAEAVRKALEDFAADAHMTASDRARADQLFAALRDHDAHEARRITGSRDDPNS